MVDYRRFTTGEKSPELHRASELMRLLYIIENSEAPLGKEPVYDDFDLSLADIFAMAEENLITYLTLNDCQMGHEGPHAATLKTSDEVALNVHFNSETKKLTFVSKSRDRDQPRPSPFPREMGFPEPGADAPDTTQGKIADKVQRLFNPVALCAPELESIKAKWNSEVVDEILKIPTMSELVSSGPKTEAEIEPVIDFSLNIFELRRLAEAGEFTSAFEKALEDARDSAENIFDVRHAKIRIAGGVIFAITCDANGKIVITFPNEPAYKIRFGASETPS